MFIREGQWNQTSFYFGCLFNFLSCNLGQSHHSSWLSFFLDEDDDIFKPPKLTDEDFTPFGSRGGLFSGGTGLFDDEEVRMLERIEIKCVPLSNEKVSADSQLWKARRGNSILLLSIQA